MEESIISRLVNILNSEEKRRLLLLFVAVVIMATLQVVSIGSVMPFLSVASDPSTIQSNRVLRWGYEIVGFKSTSSYLVFLGCLALVFLVLSNCFIVYTTWILKKFIWELNHSLSCRLLRRYLNKPYEFFITRNSSELGKNILEEVKEVTSRMLRPILEGLAKSIVVVFIISFLVYIDPTVAILATIVLGTAYVLTYLAVESKLDKAGKGRVNANSNRYKYVSEAFGGIKEVKLKNKEESFVKKFVKPSIKYKNNQIIHGVTVKVPKYLLEAVAFGGIILIAIYLILARNNIGQVVPILGTYAFAGYRLLPAMQRSYRGMAGAKYNTAALKKIEKELTKDQKSKYEKRRRKKGEETKCKDSYGNEVVLRNVSFSYPGSSKMAVQNINLTIPRNETTGLVGKTGSGKTTTVDIMLGLLRPNKGTVKIDDEPIDEYGIKKWQSKIGYVPQSIYLTDDTIAKNIAFGEKEENISMDRVIKAARKANIYNFISNSLANGWKSNVGERGVKLSGGQRQRIGIARALYYDPSVLVFDEATSALDQKTEKEIMSDVNKEFESNYTMVIISHRKSTLQEADKIVTLKDGYVKSVKENSTATKKV